jgi:hypothetical protein
MSIGTNGRLNQRRDGAVDLVRVPGVYLAWAHQPFFTFFAVNRINKLRDFSVAFSSIPTAPTNIFWSSPETWVTQRT